MSLGRLGVTLDFRFYLLVNWMYGLQDKRFDPCRLVELLRVHFNRLRINVWLKLLDVQK